MNKQKPREEQAEGKRKSCREDKKRGKRLIKKGSRAKGGIEENKSRVTRHILGQLHKLSHPRRRESWEVGASAISGGDAHRGAHYTHAAATPHRPALLRS